MNARQTLGMIWLLLAFAACSGSGSSGFDAGPAGESAAIQQALDQQQCVRRGTLTICPADTEPTLAATPSFTPTPTVTPTNVPVVTATAPPASSTVAATATATFAGTLSPSFAATVTPASTATPTVGSLRTPTLAAAATATATSTATRPPTATPTGMHIDTSIDGTAPVACVQTSTPAGCTFTFAFFPRGFPPSAAYRVAVRTAGPAGEWSISSEVAPSGPLGASDFETPVTAPGSVSATDHGASIQVAVLVFEHPPQSLPSSVQLLADTGADFAFVTPALTLQPSN